MQIRIQKYGERFLVCSGFPFFLLVIARVLVLVPRLSELLVVRRKRAEFEEDLQVVDEWSPDELKSHGVLLVGPTKSEIGP